MSKEIILNSGWVKLERAELDKLRESIREKYIFDGGSKNFNSHLPNYEELRSLIKANLDELKAKGTVVRIQGQSQYDLIPGNTYFRELFFTKKDADSAQFQEYNIDICFIYAFGKPRLETIRQSKAEVLPKSTGNSSGSKLIISSTLNNMTESERIKNHLLENFGIQAETDLRNFQAYSKGSLGHIYNNLEKNSYIITLISRDYLQNEDCLKSLIKFSKDNPDLYIKNTVHILLKDLYEGDFNIFDSLGRSELLKYWKLRIEQLEENHKVILGDKKDRDFYLTLSKELNDLKEIIEELYRVIDLIKESSNTILYEIFLSKITSLEQLEKFFPKKEQKLIISDKLEMTYKKIKIPSNNNPSMPEFPPAPFYKPHFPASSTYRITVPGFSNVWLKDESSNPTGTHKDRLAWEVVIKYKSLIEELKYKNQRFLPQMSIISSGSAAIAIQHLFNLFKIPTKLKVLVDIHLQERIKEQILSIGCELFQTDLSEKLLSSEDIKALTNNKSGIDITYREVLDPAYDNYYDWLSYEILNQNADYCFIPFGTGDLFINILNIVKAEYFNSFVLKKDPRFSGDLQRLTKCHFIGASSKNSSTKLEKLFSNFLPSVNSFKKYIFELKEEYICVGNKTDFYFVDEKFVDRAISVAKTQDIEFEPSGIAGLAMLLQMKESVPKNSKILIVNTGKTKSVEELLEFEKSFSELRI